LKKITVFLLIVLMATTLTACDGNVVEPTPMPEQAAIPTPTPELTPTPSPEPTPEPVPEPEPEPDPTADTQRVTEFDIVGNFTDTPETIEEFDESLQALRATFFQIVEEAQDIFNEDVNSDSFALFDQVLDDIFYFYDNSADRLFAHIDNFNDQQHEDGEIDIGAFIEFYNEMLRLFLDSYNEILTAFLYAYNAALQAYLESLF